MKSHSEIARILRRTPGAAVIDSNQNVLGTGVAFALGRLRCIATSSMSWDHVSVSLTNRCPNWGEMERVRKLVTAPGEIWIQYGMPPQRHINCHPYVLHWWRPQTLEIPTPPEILV